MNSSNAGLGSITLMNKTERPVYGRQPGKFISSSSSVMHQPSKSPTIATPSATANKNYLNKSANNTAVMFSGSNGGGAASGG